MLNMKLNSEQYDNGCLKISGEEYFVKICPKCKKNQLQYPLIRNGLDKDGRTYICQVCKEGSGKDERSNAY